MDWEGEDQRNPVIMAGITGTFSWCSCLLYLGGDQGKSPARVRPSLFHCFGELEGEEVVGDGRGYRE